jgi:ribosome biogenesis GTPase A
MLKLTKEKQINKKTRFNYFITSLKINTHPLLKAKEKIKLAYFAVLEYFINSLTDDAEYTKARLSQYRSFLVCEKAVISLTDKTCSNAVRLVVDDFLKPWKRKYCFALLCDIALIVSHKPKVKKACDMLAKYLNKRKQAKLGELSDTLYDNRPISRKFKNVENLIIQFRLNRDFTAKKEMRIMVTANMSAGKSTLINAIIGKPVAKASQEACTKNLCFIYNKPFEDGYFHLIASPLNLNATYDDLLNTGKEDICSIASYFRAYGHLKTRICLIDTPGVNSTLNSGHRKLTRKAIVEENYDKLIFVLDATKLGTDDEIKYLKYIYKNVPCEKIIFVLNKLDDFKTAEDSISESINGVKTDLQKIGFDNPVICPFSAYFSLLLKRKQNNEKLNEDEQDVFDHYVKKFNKPEYDLSKYYKRTVGDRTWNGDGLQKLNFISGIYDLENILYGGTKN